MSTTIDARGLSCPQPVLMFMDATKSSADKEFIVLVDSDASMENVSRAAESKNCTVTVTRQADEYRLDIVRPL
ncbi:MAG: preprotein translocase subunit TatB [Desulfobacterales bacterium RIFOXYA12_FULL_46_15]|nr:MAG: preprotein translocase subunit TatB [Desulfobacterales bacterium RIFOXYA12_FULL_46_15]